MSIERRIEFPGMKSEANLVYGRLWMGDAPPIGFSIGLKFDVLVLAAMEYQPAQLFNDVEVVQAPMDDLPTPIRSSMFDIALHASHTIAGALADGKTVLVTCLAGLNRSGLISAMSLMEAYGMSADDAILKVREARGPNALCNHSFTRFLRTFNYSVC